MDGETGAMPAGCTKASTKYRTPGAFLLHTSTYYSLTVLLIGPEIEKFTKLSFSRVVFFCLFPFFEHVFFPPVLIFRCLKIWKACRRRGVGGREGGRREDCDKISRYLFCCCYQTLTIRHPSYLCGTQATRMVRKLPILYVSYHNT